MYCSKCGKKVEDTDIFCGGCGNQLKEGETSRTKVEKISMEGQLKSFGISILYIVLVLVFWYFSRAKMFNFAFDESTIAQFLDKMILISETSYELSGLKVFCQICLWVFRIGLFLYLGATVMAFINRRREAKICSVVGFICNMIVVSIILVDVFVYADEFGMFYSGVDYVFDFFSGFVKESFYIYIALNIALLICGLRFSGSEENIEMKFSEKDKVLLEMAAEHRGKTNSWVCEKCGERNESFATICRKCGTSKK